MRSIYLLICKHPALWTFLFPRRAVARYEAAIDCLMEESKGKVSPSLMSISSERRSANSARVVI